jgi:hypothetical protein
VGCKCAFPQNGNSVDKRDIIEALEELVEKRGVAAVPFEALFYSVVCDGKWG